MSSGVSQSYDDPVVQQNPSPSDLPLQGQHLPLAFSQADAHGTQSERPSMCKGAGCPSMTFASPNFASSGGGTFSECSAPPCLSAFAPHASCTPQCMWKCDSPRCDEVCEPECEQPLCETRCDTPDLNGCKIQCDEPHCSVLCPERQCASSNCPSCTAQCSEPTCNLQCPAALSCRNVCEQPKCKWKCKAPTDCPAPTCGMVCEHPTNCMGSTFQQIPPLRPGETSVHAFVAPATQTEIASLLQQSATPSGAARLRGSTSPDVGNGERQLETLQVAVSSFRHNVSNITPSSVQHHFVDVPVASWSRARGRSAEDGSTGS
eukprot:TRINITY_DN44045_c0_g1_i1.p1 TRINITY_DN44045_c0_g1~~TRINITY_DN44045_c0_g1_i1.p1  ORF type:complete len:350 (+),score=63.21 TRINITY_DN44045_c0_g1_i1:95-1051(+)